MTERIYSDNPYTTETISRVISTKVRDGETCVQLDKTCFYPTSGGQLHDTGFLGDARVKDVFEENDDIFHVIEGDLPVNREIKGIIDWDRRFDHMQQHTGQHILSQCFIKTIDAETISSTLAGESSTVDIACPSLTPEEAQRTEAEANKWVFKNVPVHILYPDDAELAKMPLRKKPPAGKKTRIINIAGLDFSPCGGTHCSHTGEAGIIKIRRWEKMRGNIRIEFFCGGRALRDYQAKSQIITGLASALSAGESTLTEMIERLISENKSHQKTLQELKRQLNDYKARELYDCAERIQGTRVVSTICETGAIPDLQLLGKQVRETGPCIVMIGSRENNSFVFTVSENIELDLNEALNKAKENFPVKGGGAPGMIQGALDEHHDLAEFLKAVKDFMKKQLTGQS